MNVRNNSSTNYIWIHKIINKTIMDINIEVLQQELKKPYKTLTHTIFKKQFFKGINKSIAMKMNNKK